jgi:glycolate oxidase FAD binding subunit
LQISCGLEMQPRADILFEGTEAGLKAQSAQVKLMAARSMQSDAPRDAWNRRQEMFSGARSDRENFAVAKFATLPAEIAETVEMVGKIAASGLRWNVVSQATGIGAVRMDGAVSEIAAALQGLREWLEIRGGSLVVVRRPAGMMKLDAWGSAGDALALMQAVKSQFDPQGALNPGRFVGGI